MGIVYIPPENMWDTWIFRYGDEFHLFYLSEGDIGRAVSQDLIHWTSLPSIKNMAADGDWDAQGMNMTGSVARVGDVFYLCYGSGEGTPIGYICSRDLVTWQRHSDAPVLPSGPPYIVGSHWRDLSAYYDESEQLWHGYLFGIDAKRELPAIAHVTSKDYLSWSYEEPLFVSEPYTRTNHGFVYLEVPDYFQMGDMHYMLFSSVRSRKRSTSGRKDAAGAWYLCAESKDGPWRVPENPLLLGSGLGRYDHYVGRTVEYGDERLLYHHTWGHETVCWATPKKVSQQSDGLLVLEYWGGLDALVSGTSLTVEQMRISAPSEEKTFETLGSIQTDFMLTSQIDVSNVDHATLVWHLEEANVSRASGLRIEPETKKVSMVEVRYLERSIRSFNGATYAEYVRDEYTSDALSPGNLHLRVLSRAHQAEVYINDQWIFSMDMSDVPGSGVFGLICDSGELRVKMLEIYSLETLHVPNMEKS